jgi:hypothetical protein
MHASPVYRLASDEKGQEILKIDPVLRGKINAEALNALIQTYHFSVQNTGLSAAYWLTKTPKGRKLLLDDSRLRSLLNKETLNTVITADGPEHGKSAAEWLKTTIEGKEMIAIDPVLREKLGIQEVKELKSTDRSSKKRKSLSDMPPRLFSGSPSQPQSKDDMIVHIQKRRH